MKKILSILLNFIFSFFKIQENKITFESGRDKVDDNPLAIYEYIKKEKIKTFKLMWIVSKKTDTSMLDKNEYCYYRTLKAYYHLATSKYKIKSQSLGSLLKKRKKQICLYTDHGSYGLKMCGYDLTNAKERPPMPYTKEWDYYLAANNYSLNKNIDVTGYKGKAYATGLARTDRLVNQSNEVKKEIINKYKLQDEKRNIVLYAPSFRDEDIKKGKCSYQIEEICKLDNIKLIVTCHPQEKELASKLKLPKNVISALDEDVTKLLTVADILITDYSSVIFDYLILKRPIIFYPYDYDEYMTYRNFYLDYKKELPGPICYNEKEVIKILKNQDTLKKYSKDIESFNQKFNKNNDGQVCKRIVDKIINKEFK